MENQEFTTINPIPTENLQQQTQPVPVHSKSKLPLLLGLVLTLCLIGGGVYAYQNMFLESPEVVLKKSFINTTDITSFSFAATSTGQVTMSATATAATSSSTYVVSSNGSVNKASAEAFAFNIDVLLNTNFNAEVAKGTLATVLKVIYVQKNLYLNLTDFDMTLDSSGDESAGSPMIAGMVNGIVGSLKNKWIQMDKEQGAEVYSEQEPLSENHKAMIREYVSGMRYVKQISRVGSDKINGVNTDHLKVSVENGQELVDLIKKISLERNQPIEDEDLAKIIGQKIDFDIWIGKKDYFVYKMVSSPLVATDEAGSESSATVEVSLSNHNQPVSVSAPQGATPLKKVMEDMFGGMFGAMQ